MKTLNLRDGLTHTNKDVELILQLIGDIMIVEDEIDDVVPYFDSTPKRTADLVILGDDSWGGIVGGFIHEGHLVVVANYGDDGDTLYSLTLPIDGGRCYSIPAEDGKIWINRLDMDDVAKLVSINKG